MEISAKPQLQKVVDLIGDFICYWGFKKVHGQVWALIYLNTMPIDANYLIRELGVSKGLISITIKDLLNYRVIEEVAKDKPSTQKYKINENIFEVIAEVLANRERELLGEIDLACDLLGKVSKEKQEKFGLSIDNLMGLKMMNKQAQIFLDSIIQAEDVDLAEFKNSLNVT